MPPLLSGLKPKEPSMTKKEISTKLAERFGFIARA
jgi:hypothetical protein